MIRSARWTWRRLSPTAPITSSSAGRSGTPPTRARRRRRSRTPSKKSSRDKLLEQALQVLVVRKHHAFEQRVAAALHQDGRKVLDLDVFGRLGVVLDIDPAELGAREAFGHGEEARAVVDAGVAPLGAKAGHQEFAIRLHAWPILCMRWPEWQGCSRSPGR